MADHTVVVSDAKTVDPTVQRRTLAEVGADVVTDVARTARDVVDAIDRADADALIVDAATPVTAGVLEATDLAVVGRAGIGVDNVDVGAADAEGVAVVHVPDYCVEEVSTHALALLLATARTIPLYDRRTRSGDWDWRAGRPLRRLRGRTLGLVGFGKIPRRLSEKVAGFGMDVIAVDPHVDAAEMAGYGVEAVDFDALLDASDVVSVHAPLTDATRHLLDAAAFEALSDDALLVNTARGPVVDEDALHAALEAGELAGAGLDVMAEEPPGDSPLFAHERVVVTPHVAWYSEESRRDLSRSVAADVARVLAGDQPRNPVDPDVDWL